MEKKVYDIASKLLSDIHVAKSNVDYIKESLNAIKNHDGFLDFKINKKIHFVRGGHYKIEHELMLDIPIETIIKLLKSKLYVSENLLKKSELEFKNL